MANDAANSILCGIEAFELEDGDEWYIVGHVTDAEALEAVNRVVATYDGELFAADDLCITRAYWRDAHNPDNDEQWDKCAETDEGAEPFTLVEL